MTFNNEAVRYLASTAVMAGAFGMREKAIMIADALIALKPDDIDAHIVAATAYLTAGKRDEAIRILRDNILEKDSDRSFAKALLGMAHHMDQNMGDRDKLCTEVIEADDDPNAVQIARDLMMM